MRAHTKGARQPCFLLPAGSPNENCTYSTRLKVSRSRAKLIRDVNWWARGSITFTKRTHGPDRLRKSGIISANSATFPCAASARAFLFRHCRRFTNRSRLSSAMSNCAPRLKPASFIFGPLVDNGMFFTHEASHKVIAELFFDRGWWETNLNCVAPGLVGAGSGLGLIETKAGFAHSGFGIHGKKPRPNR